MSSFAKSTQSKVSHSSISSQKQAAVHSFTLARSEAQMLPKSSQGWPILQPRKVKKVCNPSGHFCHETCVWLWYTWSLEDWTSKTNLNHKFIESLLGYPFLFGIWRCRALTTLANHPNPWLKWSWFWDELVKVIKETTSVGHHATKVPSNNPLTIRASFTGLLWTVKHNDALRRLSIRAYENMYIYIYMCVYTEYIDMHYLITYI